jgi:hypothetical protein
MVAPQMTSGVHRRRMAMIALAGVTGLTACTNSGSGHLRSTPAPTSAASAHGHARYTAIELRQPRAVHHATKLLDGRILLTDGCTLPGCGGFDEARVSELFDPRTGSFKRGPRMLHPRASGTATLLADGRVLLTGGYPGEGHPPQNTAEVYDPAAGRFEPVAAMTTARAEQTATLTPDGRVLIAGGRNADGQALRSTEWFDPDTDTFTPGLPLDVARTAHAAVLVGDHVVLIGGLVSDRATASTSVLTDSGWRAGPRLATPRVKLGAVALDDRHVLVVGGSHSTEGRDRLRTSEVVNIPLGTVRPGPLLSEGEYKLDGAVAKLDDGRVVIAAGSRIDIYHPGSNTMSVLRQPVMGLRFFVTATPITSDEILVAGGYDPAIKPTAHAWLVRLN